MGEIIDYRQQSHENLSEMSHVITYGGVLTIKQLLPLYKGILKSGEDSLPDHERFFPIPKKHLDEPSEMYKRFEDRFLSAHDKINERVVVAGHSLGGLAAAMVGLEHPDKVAAVVCIAGAQSGIKQETAGTLALRRWINMPHVDKHISHDSGFMNEFKERIASEWSPDVSLHLISTPFDDLIVAPQGLGIELPEGQEPSRLLAAPNLPFVHRALRNLPGLPKGTRILNSRPTTHYDIPRASAVINYTRNVRLEAGNISHPVENLVVSSPASIAA